jgi:roundabout axon guidance receptor 2
VAGESVEFECGVAGEPLPRVLWRRHDGRMPVGRAHVLDDRTLRIEQTQPGDEGEYICDAENDVGAVSARATLTVHGG